MTDYERIGGEPAVRVAVEAFLRRMAADFVIGFQLEGKDLARIGHHEIQHASALLGGPSTYTGRSLQQVHEPLRIHRGQFERRLALLRVVLEEQGITADVIERWIAHDRELLPQIASSRDCLA